MMVFKHVSRINVSLWGQRVGTLVAAPQRDVYAFRYEKGFLRSGIEISPRVGSSSRHRSFKNVDFPAPIRFRTHSERD